MKGNGQDIHELTRIEAYLLSEKAGHPSYMHDYFWSQAEAIVRQRAAVVAGAVNAAGKKSAKSPPTAKPAAAKGPGPAKKPATATGKKTSEPTLSPVEKIPAAKTVAAGKPKPAAPAEKKTTIAVGGKPAAKSK